MKRREFSLSAASAVAASALTLPVANPALAQARQFKEGKDYTRLAKPLTPDAPAGKVDVIEFFWYSCSHCNAFEPALESWIKAAPKDLSIRRIPVAFNASFVPQQKLYFTLQAMDNFDAMCRMVAAGVGIGMVPRSAVGAADAVRLIEITDSWAPRDLQLCVRSRSALPAAARALLEHLAGMGSGQSG